MTTPTVTSLLRRIGVGASWSSTARIATWAIAWALVIGWVIDPAGPVPADRHIAADEPPSTVRYLGPASVSDLAGFLAPTPTDGDDVFTIAFVGGSEVKLREISLAAEVSRRISSVGGQPAQVDAYTVIAPRPLDALRAMESAIANGSDAIVVSINAVWTSDEWTMREWVNLDVANFGTLWSDAGSLPWALALESPADATWRVARAVSPVVEAQQRLSGRAGSIVDHLDVVDRTAAAELSAPDLDPRLPPDSPTFWLIDAYGPEVMADTTERVARMVEGFDDDDPGAHHFAERLLETAASAGVPVFLYVAPFSPASAANPRSVAAQGEVERFWTEIAAGVTSPLVTVEARSMTPEFADRANFHDIIHMNDPAPFAEVLRRRLCDQWRAADPALECAP